MYEHLDWREEDYIFQTMNFFPYLYSSGCLLTLVHTKGWDYGHAPIYLAFELLNFGILIIRPDFFIDVSLVALSMAVQKNVDSLDKL